jgi:hypothetical protein
MSRNKSISFTDLSDEQTPMSAQESVRESDEVVHDDERVSDSEEQSDIANEQKEQAQTEAEPQGEANEKRDEKERNAMAKKKAAIEKKERARQAKAMNAASSSSGQGLGKRTTIAVVKNLSLIALSVGATYAMQMYVLPIQVNQSEQEAKLAELADLTTQQGLSIADLSENLKIAKKQAMTNSEQLQSIDISQKNFESRMKEYIKEQKDLDDEYRALVQTVKQAAKDDVANIELANARIAIIKDTVDKNSREILVQAKELRELIQKTKQYAAEQTSQVIDKAKEASGNQARGASSKKSKAQQVTTINGLQVEDVISYGGQTLAVLTDGLSATVPITEGDMIGHAEITKITSEVVSFIDRVTGTHYEIEVN